MSKIQQSFDQGEFEYDEWSWTLEHLWIINAIENSDVAELKQLIPMMARPWMADRFGFTPLHMGVMSCQIEVVEAMIQFGASVLVNVQTNCGETPLHIAAFFGPPSICRLLIQTGAISLQNKDGQTPLHFAASQGQEQCVFALLETGANPLDLNHQRKTASQLTSVDHPRISMCLRNAELKSISLFNLLVVLLQ